MKYFSAFCGLEVKLVELDIDYVIFFGSLYSLARIT